MGTVATPFKGCNVHARRPEARLDAQRKKRRERYAKNKEKINAKRRETYAFNKTS
jgi:hypothetical protein